VRDANENANSGGISADFASRENATSADLPQLVITYQAQYTITVPASSAVVMAEPTNLNFTISHAADTSNSTDKISKINLVCPYPAAGATPPAGWKITDITGNSVWFDTEDTGDPNCSANSIGQGQSLVFGVSLTATAAAAEVASDTISSASVGNDC